ncbi:Uncharacterized protein Rs2_47905 [Raphanus sativus]|nr:Uncharacterized protein Rs2_47905 [Raphanus sativus]
MLHSRRSFVGIRSQLEADLTAMVWVAEALCDIKAKRVLLETLMLHWRVIHKECNMVATSIATSALQVQWQQFYVANNGSNWLPISYHEGSSKYCLMIFAMKYLGAHDSHRARRS